MKKIIRTLLFKILYPIYGIYYNNLSVKSLLQFFLFQRILRINSHVPWPVHWSTYFDNFEYPKNEFIHIGTTGGCYIQTIGGLKIGSNVIMGMGSKIITANHDIKNFERHICKPVVLGNNVWIGSNVVILPGVSIGDNVIIAAGSIVTKSFFENNIILAGNPAKVIKNVH